MFVPGHDIKFDLFKRNLTQVWLAEQLQIRGINTDKSELSSMLSGARTGPKADLVIETSQKIICDYDKEHKITAKG